MSSLDRIEELLRDQPRKPPVDKWQPALSGDMDMRIDRRGDWYHEGVKIHRRPLVNLFASILRREQDGHYYLLTPVEKWRIKVEDAPLIAVDADLGGTGDDRQCVFTLNTGEHILLDERHALTVAIDADSHEPRPYLQLDNGLTARIERSVFYRLVESAEERGGEYGIVSAGQWFALGAAG